MKDYVKAPSSDHDWTKISREFYLKWNFPNCIGMRIFVLVTLFKFMHPFLGAIDGKHIVIQAPSLILQL